ncbi:MAG: hypothetical protein WA061_02455 [Microgenomates group bacterium]
MNQFSKLDGRHKLATIFALIAWGCSMYFSYLGFGLDAPNTKWMGIIFAAIVTVVELVFNSSTRKLSQTLIITGLLCYFYGVWTNIVGFWDYQNPNVPMALWNAHSILPILVGFILEVLPEPLFMWGLGSQFEGDLIGNAIGLWNGTLGAAQPQGQNNNNNQQKKNDFSSHEVYSNLPRQKNDQFGFIPKEDVSVPDFINNRKQQENRKISERDKYSR